MTAPSTRAYRAAFELKGRLLTTPALCFRSTGRPVVYITVEYSIFDFRASGERLDYQFYFIAYDALAEHIVGEYRRGQRIHIARAEPAPYVGKSPDGSPRVRWVIRELYARPEEVPIVSRKTGQGRRNPGKQGSESDEG